MPFKKNDDGSLVLAESGHPIFVGPDGSEKPYDPDQKAKQIAELTEKASKRGADLEAARSKLSALDGIENLEEFLSKAKANAETVASLADKDRENEVAIQKRIAEAVKAAISPITAERDTLKGELSKTTEGFNRAVVGNAFLNSQFAREKLKNPALAERLFAGSFAVRDGKPVGRDADGNDMYGADGVATFDEALHKLVSSSPFKDDLLKSPAGGSGTQGGNGGSGGQDYSKLSPVERLTEARKAGK